MYRALEADASIVVACHDVRRWESLIKALSSLRSQQRAAVSIIVAVDNSQELYERVVACDLADTVVLNNGRRGASNTRNAGAAVATSEVIAFLDDDAYADPEWLHNLLQPFADPSVVGVGGSVEPVWESVQPTWFPAEFSWVVGATWLGLPTEQASVRNVWAENMAIRRDAFVKVNGFRSSFGKVGSVSQPEDTDLCIRSAQAVPGSTWVYVPRAVVHHLVPAARSNVGFFLRRCHNEGRGKAKLAYLMKNEGSSRLTAEEAYLKEILPRAAVRYMVAGMKDPLAFRKLVMLALGTGAAVLGYLQDAISLTVGTRLPRESGA